MKTVYVTFAGHNKRYAYLYDGVEPIKAGDHAVVDSPSGGLQVVKIEDVIMGSAPIGSKYIVTHFSIADYEARLRKALERDAILKQLHMLECEQDEVSRFERLAQNNPKAAELLGKLKEL